MKNLTFFIAALMLWLSSKGQIYTIELSFTSNYYEQYVPLDSIFIENLTQGGDTVLYADTILTLLVTGIKDSGLPEAGFDLVQNYPNPFRDKTSIGIYLAKDDILHLDIHNLTGQKVATFQKKLDRGHHAFNFYPGTDKLYLLTATVDGITRSLKMVGMHNQPGNICKLEYVETKDADEHYKSKKGKSEFLFNPGDSLRCIGFASTPDAITGSDVFIDAPETSQNFTFNISEGTPCPEFPAIIYEGQMYTTVLIDSQCWFKENLNVGIMIEGVQEMQDNGEIERYCYGDHSLNCDIFGGLYQWDETMQYTSQPGTQGICPEGWHIPTESEMDIAVSFLGGAGVAGGKMKETGTLHWLSPNTGATNESGFTGIGAGFRFHDGTFSGIKDFTSYWSSNETSPGSGYARVRQLYANEATVGIYGINKLVGFSVRCLKDE